MLLEPSTAECAPVTRPARLDEPWLAVSLHDVEPATFMRCALIRDWLADLGVDRVTLLVIPAPRLRPFFQSSPRTWRTGCANARTPGTRSPQHGFTHRGLSRGASSEFLLLARAQTR